MLVEEVEAGANCLFGSSQTSNLSMEKEPAPVAVPAEVVMALKAIPRLW